MAETVGDDWATARVLNSLGYLELMFDPAGARVGLTRSIELGEASGDEWAVADGWKMMTIASLIAHDEDGANQALNALRCVAEKLESGFFLAWYHSELGYFEAMRGDFEAAQTNFATSAEWCRQVGDPSTGGLTEAWSLGVQASRGDLEGAATGLEALLVRANASGGGSAVPECISSLADIALSTGDTAAACALAEPLIESTLETGPPHFTALGLRALGAARRIEGAFEEAQAALEQAAGLVAPLGNEWLLARIEYELGLVAYARGESTAAEDLLHTALSRQVRHDLKPGIAATLDALGRLAFDADSTSEAVRCFAAADGLRAALGLAARAFDEAERAPYVDRARETLGEDAFDLHSQEAANAALDEIVEYVSRARGERKRPLAGWDSLTPTELRIVTLVAAGLTNPQIAERMFIARGTVKVHLSHVFAKLGVATRAELAARATKRGLAEA